MHARTALATLLAAPLLLSLGTAPASARDLTVAEGGTPASAVRTDWSHVSGGVARARIRVTVDDEVRDRPRLQLQRRVSGRWRTIDSGAARRSSTSAPWRVRLGTTVSGPAKLRVVGHGPGWRVRARVPSYFRSGGHLVVDGAAVTVTQRRNGIERLTFDARAGESLVLINDQAAIAVLYGPDGRELVPDANGDVYAFTPRVSGQHILDVGAGSGPATLRLARPRVADVPTDGSTVVLPAVPDVRVPRIIRVTANAGDVIVGSDWWSSAGCKDNGFLLQPTSTTTITQALDCPTTEPVNVRLVQSKIMTTTLSTEPLTVSADAAGQPVALRFTTTEPTGVTIDMPWSSPTEVLLRWPGSSHSNYWTSDTSASYPSGTHVVVIRPRPATDTLLSGEVTLSAVERR